MSGTRFRFAVTVIVMIASHVTTEAQDTEQSFDTPPIVGSTDRGAAEGYSLQRTRWHLADIDHPRWDVKADETMRFLHLNGPQFFTHAWVHRAGPISALTKELQPELAVELGWFPNEGKANEGMYHITFWNINARQNAGKQSDNGLAMTLEQHIGIKDKLVPFLRYAIADRGINGIQEDLSIGLGIEDVLGQNDDLIGLACSWQTPADQTLRNQFVFETFYRFYITPHTHLTPDIQVVVDPANAPTKNAVTVFGLRLRTLY